MNYFIAPRSGETSHENFKSTLKHGVPIQRIESFLTESEASILIAEDVIYAWGNREGTKSAWDKMENGDMVIFYARGYLVMSGIVYLKKHSPEMAEALWPLDENGNPWEYVFFIKDLHYYNVPIKIFNSAVGYSPNAVIMGFTHLSDERLQGIINTYGSVQELLNLFVDKNSEEIPLSNEQLFINLHNIIAPVVIDNPTLKPKVKWVTAKTRKPVKVDYEMRNRNNSITGSKGEVTVLNYEKSKLIEAGRSDLASKVKRISLDDDSLGYDISSFDKEGKQLYIEVKTTTTDNNSLRFHLSANEFRKGKLLENYLIYFVEDVDSLNPTITIVHNPLDENKFSIKPDGYIFEAER